MQIKPMEQKVLIRPKEAESKTEGGIYIPEDAKEKTQEGEVIATGTGKDGKAAPFKKGDRVIYESYAGTEIKISGKKHMIMSHKDVLGVIE